MWVKPTVWVLRFSKAPCMAAACAAIVAGGVAPSGKATHPCALSKMLFIGGRSETPRCSEHLIWLWTCMLRGHCCMPRPQFVSLDGRRHCSTVPVQFPWHGQADRL
mmetsp:Transcript_8096/g.22377  ORF Transcript_8096/g.22377 Transcript_8096/m.22377 type:complete len:106 (-) Transcript_8096:48-365(-)